MLKLLAEDPRPQTNISFTLYIFLFEKIRLWLSKLWKANLKIKIIRKRRKTPKTIQTYQDKNRK